MNAVLLSLALIAQEERLEAAFQRVREAVERDEIPGAIALVARDGKPLRHEAFGQYWGSEKAGKVREDFVRAVTEGTR